MKQVKEYSLSLSRVPYGTALLPVQKDGALFWNEERWSANDLEGIVRRLAVSIQAQSSTEAPSGYCIVASEDPLTVLLSCLAVWRSGRVVVLPNNLKAPTLQDLRTSRFSDRPQKSVHPLLDGRCFEEALRTRAQAPAHSPFSRSHIEEEAPVVICFTSGSTGTPKAHEKNARQVLGEAQLLARLYFDDLEGPVSCSVPAYHLYGLLFSCLAPFFAHLPLLGAVGVSEGIDVSAPPLRKLIAADHAQALVSVPAHLHALLGTEKEQLVAVRRVFSSAAPLPASLGTAIINLDRAPQLVEAWGSTETGGVATRVNNPGGPWVVLPGIEIEASDAGHLRLRSPFAPGGVEETYLTADRISVTAQGFVHEGRDDGVLKVGGKRISLQDLESCALAHPQVIDVACAAEQARGIRNQRVVMAVASSAPHLNARDLLRHLACHFDEVVLPRKVRIVSQLPRTDTGKILRKDLLALFTMDATQTAASPPALIQSRLEAAGFVDVITHAVALTDTGARLQVELSTHEEQLWFKGHFPNIPLLPGVVQLRSLVLGCCQATWPELGELTRLGKVKFRRPILPGDRISVTLTRHDQKKTVSFSIAWLESTGKQRSPLLDIIPQILAAPAPFEASSGVLTFGGGK